MAKKKSTKKSNKKELDTVEVESFEEDAPEKKVVSEKEKDDTLKHEASPTPNPNQYKGKGGQFVSLGGGVKVPVSELDD